MMADHSGLRYFFDQPNLNVRKARWLDTLSRFDFEIKYIKGKENNIPDSISRRVHVNHIATMSYYEIDLKECILQVGQHDDRYHQLRHSLQK